MHSQNMVVACPWFSHSGAFERRVLRRILGGITVNENGRKRYNGELMQLFVYLDIISFVELSRCQLIGHITRMDIESEGIKIFNNNPQGSPLRGRPNQVMELSTNRY